MDWKLGRNESNHKHNRLNSQRQDKRLKFYENGPRLRSEEVCPYVFFTKIIIGVVLDFYSVSFLNF